MSQLSRRSFLQGTAGVGLIAVTGAGLSACATGGGGNKDLGHEDATRQNPFGVKPDAPLVAYFFKGGYGDAPSQYDVKMYQSRFPKAHVTYRADPGIEAILQKMFVQGKPPDVSPTTSDYVKLIDQGQVSDLSQLLDAPAYDTPGKTVRETLTARTVEVGTFNKKTYVLSYSSEAFGVWYSKPLLDKHGWEYPKTWDDMTALCGEIKQAGIAPWTFQGKYPGYVVPLIMAMAAKAGGPDVLKSIDNLAPNAWLDESVQAAAARMHDLVTSKYILPGSNGLTHTQSQLYWTQGKAAFIPCGSWLENEMSSLTPKGFDMVMSPTPSLSAADKLPFAALQAGPSNAGFVVPTQAANKYGGFEFLRMMLSKQAAAEYSKLTNSLTTVAGYADQLTLSSAFNSTRDATTAAGANALAWQYAKWYPKLEVAVENATGELMGARIDAPEWAKRCQKAADDTAKDKSVTKYHR